MLNGSTKFVDRRRSAVPLDTKGTTMHDLTHDLDTIAGGKMSPIGGGTDLPPIVDPLVPPFRRTNG